MLILRYGVRPISGRSECPHCEKKLAWLDLVPVLSWVWLRGRCRYCKNSISIQYPLVELLTALVFTLIGVSLIPTPVRVLGLAAAALLIAIFFYDLRHKIIPDPWVWTFNALAFLALIFNFQFSRWSYRRASPLFYLVCLPRSLDGFWRREARSRHRLASGTNLRDRCHLFCIFYWCRYRSYTHRAFVQSLAANC